MRNATLLLNHGFTSAYSAASAKLRLDVVVRQEIKDSYLAGPRYRAAPPGDHRDGRVRGVRSAARFREGRHDRDGVTEIREAVRLCAREGVDNVNLDILGRRIRLEFRAELVSISQEEFGAGSQPPMTIGKRVGPCARRRIGQARL